MVSGQGETDGGLWRPLGSQLCVHRKTLLTEVFYIVFLANLKLTAQKQSKILSTERRDPRRQCWHSSVSPAWATGYTRPISKWQKHWEIDLLWKSEQSLPPPDKQASRKLHRRHRMPKIVWSPGGEWKQLSGHGLHWDGFLEVNAEWNSHMPAVQLKNLSPVWDYSQICLRIPQT